MRKLALPVCLSAGIVFLLCQHRVASDRRQELDSLLQRLGERLDVTETELRELRERELRLSAELGQRRHGEAIIFERLERLHDAMTTGSAEPEKEGYDLETLASDIDELVTIVDDLMQRLNGLEGTNGLPKGFVPRDKNGAIPVPLTAGDFDGDGRVDLYVENHYFARAFHPPEPGGSVTAAALRSLLDSSAGGGPETTGGD